MWTGQLMLAAIHIYLRFAAVFTIRLFGQEGMGHDTCYSLPTVSELAALIVGGLTTDVCRFDVVVQSRMGYLEQISPLNRDHLTAHY